METLEGKCGIITGGTFGIGIECAKELLSKGLEKLAVLDISVKHDSCRRLIAQFGKTRVYFIQCDVSKPNEMEESFKMAYELFGRLDMVINNAGILDDLNWEKEVLVNMNGTIKGTLLGLKYMSKAEGGSGGTIVNVSSLSGLVPSAGCPIYSTVSYGIIGLSKAFSMPYHYQKSGVRILTMCPGITYTKIIAGASKKMLNVECGKELLKQLSMVSTQKPENVAIGMLNMIMNGENGSIWISEGGQQAYRIELPNISEMYKI